MIDAENIPGIIFLTGDRHFSEITKMEREGKYPLFDFTISPFTSGPSKNNENEPNFMRVPGSYYEERNFCTFEISGKRKGRQIIYKTFNNNGEQVYQFKISENELKNR
ncbi:MAG: hypothetical protein K9I71_01490 [Ignavibacteriales bacterium]|nr:hypothetical protein [Ignavibacteriales bacterium]MCF8314762.1 hypothetical protein [Ignavibacteriales bacterium]MCF8437990.1 hypothetical protein [Ignavibacteriales bacterium]